MPTIKTKKKKKSVNMRGKNMGTHGGGARKKRKKSGHRGGSGMAGTGKRSDQKKTLVLKLYGHGYFGKQGITSKGGKKDKRDRINLNQIEINLEKYGKKTGDTWELNLKRYKILSGLKDYKVKNKLRIHATEASKTALAKVKEAGGEILIENNVKKEWLNSPREDFQEQDVNKPLNIIKKILEYRDKLTKLEEGFH